MKNLGVLAILTLVTVAALGDMTTESPKRSSSTGENGNAILIDEGSRRVPVLGVVYPDSTGATGLNNTYYTPGKVSPVTAKEEPPQYTLSSGKKVPVYALAQLNPSTRTLSAFPVLPGPGSSRIKYVDCRGGDDVNGTGTITQPYKTLEFAQSTITDADVRSRFIHLLSSFCNEAPTYQPSGYIRLLGEGSYTTYIGHTDDSPFVISYGATDIGTLYQGVTFLDEVDFTRVAAQTTFADFSFLGVDFSAGLVLTGAGSNIDVLDAAGLDHSSVEGGLHSHAYALIVASGTTVDHLYVDGTGVDGEDTLNLRTNLDTANTHRVDVAGNEVVDARSTAINIVTIDGTSATFFGDASSYPIFGLTLTGGALSSQATSTSPFMMTLNGDGSPAQMFANDTNVTITTSAGTHTLGWAGTLAAARGGTGMGAAPAGAVLYSNGTTWVALPAGTAGQVLTSGGASAPTWQ